MSVSSRSWRARSPYFLIGGLALLLGAAAARAASGSPAPDSPAAPAAPLAPPPIIVLTSKPGVDPGLIFVAPKQTPPSATQQGPEIIDNQGRPFWFQAVGANWDDDGDVLIDARNTWTAYKIDRRTKEIIWRQGGKSSTFALSTGDNGTQTAWQHDPELVDGRTLRFFDNEAAPSVLPYSRVVWIRQNAYDKTSTVVKQIVHPDKIQAGSQGNAQALDWGHTFVGWGATGRFSEFDADGNLLFDATVPTTGGWDDYRAYRFVWHGTPDTSPTATVQKNADGSVTVHAIWNGATEVSRWIVIGGEHASALWPLGKAEWNGLDTAITLRSDAQHVAVVAEDAHGRLIGRSASTVVTP